MLANRVRILNFDNSLTSQKTLLERYRPAIVPLTHLEPASRLWLDKRGSSEIKRALDPGLKNSVTFLGSGDFHHVSLILSGQFDEDFSMVIFDLHPDLDNLPPRLSCGSWVNIAARRKEVKKIIMLGPSSSDLDFPNNITFNLSWLKNGRVELYPYYHKPSLTLFKTLYWENLRDKDIGRFTRDTIRHLPSKNVYLSVDKDCLSREYAVTNWEPGVFILDTLLSALRILNEEANIIGMDITGDYSPFQTRSIFKNISAWWDHPAQWAEKMDPAEVIRINERTNLKLLELLVG